MMMQMSHNFLVTNADTDSITICKPDQSPFSKEEQAALIEEINNLLPEYIKFDNDGIFEKFIVLKAKNYIMYDGKKIKLKGSSLKSSTIEPVLKSMLNEMIDALVFDKEHTLKDIYHKYVKEACNITDIKKWAKKITISTKTLESERANETKIIDALKRHEIPYSEGDRFYVFFLDTGELEIADKFDGRYDRDQILEKIFKTTKRFETILPVKELFINYSLKRGKKPLEELLNT